MKEKQIHLVWMGLLLAVSLVVLIGCSGGGSSGSAGSSTTPSYDVAGETSGLLGTGLVLQNNGTDDLAITGDGWFKFPTRIKDGSTCNVTVLSQPTSPDQTCKVLNGSRTISGDSITDLTVECSTTMLETFDDGGLNSGYWHSSGEYDRRVVNGELQYRLAGAGEFAFDYLPFLDKECGKISADVRIAEPVYTGTGDEDFRVRLQSCGYHTTTEDEAPGSSIGDVVPAITWRGTAAYYSVYKCITEECSTPEAVVHLTPSEGVLLGEAAPNSTVTLLIDWDNLAPGQFTFQMNNGVPLHFDPVAAGAPINAAVPNKPEKYLGLQVASLEPAVMLAIVDNVTDGDRVENFNGKYVDGSFWKKTNGSRRIENGKLVLETAQEFVDDPTADNRLNNTTTLRGNYDLIFTGDEVVEADMALDPSTFVVDGTPADSVEVFAMLEMEYRPPGANRKDYTNFFAIRAALEEGPQGVTAEMLAFGCVDSSCISKHTIANDKQTFNTPVAKGMTYHLSIEHMGNGLFDITLDGMETLSVDLSSIAEFGATEFAGVRLSTASQGTDSPGEEAFVRAMFDNVRSGRL